LKIDAISPRMITPRPTPVGISALADRKARSAGGSDHRAPPRMAGILFSAEREEGLLNKDAHGKTFRCGTAIGRRRRLDGPTAK